MNEGPVFETVQVGNRPLVICKLDGVQGAARIFSAGIDDARKRAEKNVRDKLKERDAK